MGGLERSDRSVVPWRQPKDLQYPWVFARRGSWSFQDKCVPKLELGHER
jgi:hypothetical protein